MTNPTTRKEVETLSNSELDERVATEVMEWHKFTDMLHFMEVWSDSGHHLQGACRDWSPTTDLNHTFMLVEKIMALADTKFQFIARAPSIWSMTAQEAARAITIATLCAKLGL